MAADANLIQCLKFCESLTGSGLLFTVNVKIGDFTFSLETMKEKGWAPLQRGGVKGIIVSLSLRIRHPNRVV